MDTQAARELVHQLQQAIGAEQVRFDHMTRVLYSTDASNYQVMPIGVTFPRSADEVAAIHEIATKHRVPLLPRGAGSSLAGQTVNTAIVMDFTRHMRRVRSINAEERSIVVEPGLVLGLLNKQVAPLGLAFGPDPASAERASVGGCIGNNATGAHSILYGMTADHVKRIEVVLPSGERTWLDADNATVSGLREKVRDMVTTHRDEIALRYPKTWRTVAGYALNKIDPEAVRLEWLLGGSEGTLATMVAAELNLVPRPLPALSRVASVHFDSLRTSLEMTPRILETSPSAIELLDKFLLDKTRENKSFAPLLTFVVGDPAVLLTVEYYGESESELDAKVASLKALLKRIGHRGEVTLAITPKEQADVWAVRKAGLNLLTSARGDIKPSELIEDAAVPVEHLADYIDEVSEIIEREGTSFAIYAHASAGCLHIRPLLNLKSERGLQQYRAIGSAVADAVVKYGGTISGEHGTGIVRSEFSDRLFGPTLVGAFRELKAAFDPLNLLNPGRMVDPPRMDDTSLMRHSPHEVIIPIQTRYDWSEDFGLIGATEMCNGAGVCRKEGNGTMCPSYMATLDESHATRGRANALRNALMGRVPEGLSSEEVHGVFDLCLSCKACKAECPSSVDAARMKSEFLASYQDTHGTPMASRVFANIHRLNRMGSVWPAFSNAMLNGTRSIAPIRWAAERMGIPMDRPLPKLAPRRFSKMASSTDSVPQTVGTLVIDTFTEFNHPQVGEALLKIVRALGVELNIVRLPGDACCGRPAISKGLLDYAKTLASANVQFLMEHMNNAPFIFLEPSCQSAFTDDYLTLVEPALQETARHVRDRCMSAETWVVQQLGLHTPTWDERPREILLHGHCHQKALWSTAETLHLLRSIPNATVSEIDSGCCGVAGSFGYEHYELSMKIGEQRLLPTLRSKPEALVAAPGTSCRAQIHDAGLAAQHPIEIVAGALG
jgi:FAD/FMN-containing dehydrogenase/Fe-S oxidoreductase